MRAGTIPDGPVAREGPERPVQAAPAADGSAPADMARLRSAQTGGWAEKKKGGTLQVVSRVPALTV